MKSKLILATLAALSLAGAAHSAITVQNTNFIAAPSYFNGFEDRSAFSLPYTSDHITVSYVGSMAYLYSSLPAEGDYSWYAVDDFGTQTQSDPRGYGYTDIRLDNGAAFSAIQFLVASAYYDETVALNYQVLKAGVVQTQGTTATLPDYLDAAPQAGFRYYGFSGGSFDEVRLQVNGVGHFDETRFEAGIIDSIAIGSVPEPGVWSLLIAGFGLTGAALRNRRRPVAVGAQIGR